MSKNSILVPDVGSDAEVEVIEILVGVGDSIAIDDPVVVLESDKASIEVPANYAGQVASLSVKVGDKVKQGDALLLLNDAEQVAVSEDSNTESAEIVKTPAENPVESASDPKPDQAESSPAREVLQEVRVPDVGGASEVEVIEVSVTKGSRVEVDDALLVLESDKASMDIPSPFSGVVTELNVKVGDKLGEGDLIALIQASATSVQESESEESKQTSGVQKQLVQQGQGESTRASLSPEKASETSYESSDKVHAGPAVRKLARELGVELNRVKPTGPKGRVQKEDLNTYIKMQVRAAQEGQVSGVPSAPALPDFSQFGEIENRKMDKLHLLTARNMQASWSNVPHVTQFDEADITELERFRKAKKTDAEEKGVRLTPLPFLIKACAHALRALPQFNISLDMANQQLIQKHYYHIGVAVDTHYGLVVPVIRDVLEKDLWQISEELGSLADKAKARKLAPQDMQGACFTISSLGSIGGTAFTPIVNQPEVAILGVSKAQLKPVYIGSEFVPRLMLPLSLSYDHRAVNGADAARFTALIAKYLSDIRELLF